MTHIHKLKSEQELKPGNMKQKKGHLEKNTLNDTNAQDFSIKGKNHKHLRAMRNRPVSGQGVAMGPKPEQST